MAVAKKKRKKKGSKQRKRVRQWLFFIGFAGFFVVLGGLFVFLVFGPEDVALLSEKGDSGDGAPPISYEEIDVSSDPIIVESEGEKDPVGPAKEELVVGADRPLVAIVIDDMGYNKKICDALIKLDFNLSFAFLPFGPYTAKQAYKANRRGRDVLLHFPMEATDAKWKPGPGTVTIGMDSTDIQRIFDDNLASVPYAVGINNHMGSRFTQNSRGMQNFMESMQETELFFLDSRTSRNSVGYSLAREMGIKSAKRDIFLDNVRDSQKIIIQLRKLLGVAQRQGVAIAIGHPYPETLQALKEYKSEILRRVEVVGIEALVR